MFLSPQLPLPSLFLAVSLKVLWYLWSNSKVTVSVVHYPRFYGFSGQTGNVFIVLMSSVKLPWGLSLSEQSVIVLKPDKPSFMGLNARILKLLQVKCQVTQVFVALSEVFSVVSG